MHSKKLRSVAENFRRRNIELTGKVSEEKGVFYCEVG